MPRWLLKRNANGLICSHKARIAIRTLYFLAKRLVDSINRYKVCIPHRLVRDDLHVIYFRLFMNDYVYFDPCLCLKRDHGLCSQFHSLPFTTSTQFKQSFLSFIIIIGIDLGNRGSNENLATAFCSTTIAEL